jgi:hypothetical protein
MNSKQPPPIQPIQNSPRGISKSPVNELKSPSWINHFGHFDLASAFEVAQIAISLSVMKGEAEPDLDGAFKLIQNADLHIQNINNAAKEKEDLERAERAKELRTQRVVGAIVEGPIESLKTFPGSEKINAPKRFPASTASCWRALLGRSLSKKELKETLDFFEESNPKLGRLKDFTPHSENTFWSWAALVVKGVPKFADLYGKTPKRKPRKRNKNNQFTTEKRTKEGKFVKKSARSRK